MFKSCVTCIHVYIKSMKISCSNVKSCDRWKGKTCFHMSHVMGKQDHCLCKNKGADQLCSNCTASLTGKQQHNTHFFVVHVQAATSSYEQLKLLVIFCGGAQSETQVFPPHVSYEPPHRKTNNLHRRKQRRRSASR